MKKKLFVLVAMAVAALSVMSCSSNTDEGKSVAPKEEKKEYISDSEIDTMLTNPDQFTGKYVKLTGKLFTSPEKKEDKTALQVWHNPQNAQDNFIIYYSGDETFSVNDYLSVDGKILGTVKGENLFGTTVSAPLIESDTVVKMSYIDAVVPTTVSYTLTDLSFSQNDVTVKIDKVEYADVETRVYVTAINESQSKFNLYTSSIKLVQNGQQIEQDSASVSTYEGNYPQLSYEILPGATSSGILVYPKMDHTIGFQMYAEGSSDNWEIQFQPFVLQMNVAK
jgi:hypothetical protein|nr:MAG TPA: protein of unknown function (DUF4969) [Caudoviricetes sp.]